MNKGIEDECAVVGGEKILVSRVKKKAFWEVLTNFYFYGRWTF